MNLSTLIPENKTIDNSKELLIQKILKDLESKVESWNYHPCSIKDAEEICKAFVAKGYHAKINYFTDGRAAYQAFIISKVRLKDSNAKLIYSEIFG